jgi:hypothetical protein
MFGILAQSLNQDWNDDNHSPIFMNPGERAYMSLHGPSGLERNIFAM